MGGDNLVVLSILMEDLKEGNKIIFYLIKRVITCLEKAYNLSQSEGFCPSF